MRAGWMQGLPGAPQTTPRGELWAAVLTAEDVVERRAHLPWVSWATTCMADTRARMSANSMECDEARVQFDTHYEQLATSIRKRSHVVKRQPIRWSLPTVLHEYDHPNRGREQVRNVNGYSTRPRTRSRRPTTTSTASPSMPRSHKIGSTPCSSKGHARAPIAIGRSALHQSHTLSHSWKTDARGSAQRADTWRFRALKLALSCPRTLPRVGRRNMSAIQNGRKLD